MTDLAIPFQQVRVPSRALAAFIDLTFLITWGLVSPYILAPEWAAATFGQISGAHPFFFIATWSPAISAIGLVLFFQGTSGLGAFLSRLFIWRGSVGWGLFILFGIPSIYALGSHLKGGPVLSPMPEGGPGAVFAVLSMMAFLGPIEEIGWRGMAQPILQRHVAPVWAGATIGTIWGVWHLPAFYLAGTVYADWDFLPFFVGNVTLAILVTPLFNKSRGSLLWPALFHWQLINPFWADAQPYDTWIFVVVTIVVVWWNRVTMLRRQGAVTEVIPGERNAEQ